MTPRSMQAYEGCAGMAGAEPLEAGYHVLGLYVHKETIAVALAETGKRNGKIANPPTAVTPSNTVGSVPHRQTGCRRGATQ